MTPELQIDELAQAIATRLQPAVPFDRVLWTAAEAAAYLRVATRTVAERYAARPDFPTAIRLPTEGRRGLLRWRATEIVKWAERRQ